MGDLQFLLNLAIILLATKLLGLLTKQFQLPQVVGALLAGLLLGPAVLNILEETEFIQKVAQIGVIVLMFGAGVETDISELKKSGKASIVIAILGMVIPIIGGFVVASIFNMPSGLKDTTALLQNIFIGVILSATSVSITVETLKEMGRLSTKAGNAILSAAIIDDILGVVALTIVISLAGASISIQMVLLKIVSFFLFIGLLGFLFYKVYKKWTDYYHRDLRRFIIAAFVFCLLMSYCADRFFGVADITGAYISGLIISGTGVKQYVARRFNTLSYMMFSPVFFASIGLKVTFPQFTWSIIGFSVLLIVIAVLTKVLGCSIGAKLCGYDKKDSLRIGVGMIARGEVALIIANRGGAMGLLLPSMLTPIVLLVVCTSVLSPILLKIVFQDHVLSDTHEDTPIAKSFHAQLDINKKP